MKKSPKLGFSLIELSVVILVIGILVIGITQGSRIISAAKLKSAQALTISSPVASTSGLSLWLETTSDKSFDSTSATNNNLIANWYDLNPQTTTPNNANQPTDNNKPTYLAQGINSLPSLRFFGSPNASTFPNYDYLTLTNNTLAKNGQLTLFVVYNLNVSGIANYFIGHQDGWTRWRFGNAQFQSNKGNVTNFGSWSPIYPNLLSAVVRDNTVTLKQNGVASGNNSLTSGEFVEDNQITIGGAETSGPYSLDGMIGEIVVYNRGLKDQEVVIIEDYLKQKWGVR